MKDFGLFSAKVLLLICPQTFVSLAAIYLYARHGMFPSKAIGLHLLMIVLIQLVFFGLWAEVLRLTDWPRQPWVRITYALSLVAKGLALNFVYAVSYITGRLWYYYLSWGNLRVGLQELDGFYQSLGWIVPVTLLVFVLFLIGLALFYYWFASFRLAQIKQAMTGRSSRLHTVIFTAATLLLALTVWNNEPNTAHFIPKDPLLSFWGNFPVLAKQPALTPSMLALHLARDFVPPKKFQRKNVIIITIDCLRRDHLSPYGYGRHTTPFIENLVAAGNAQSVTFAISNGTFSGQGKRSILGSRLPHEQLLYDFKVQDALKRAGYHTYLVAAGDNTSLGDMRKHFGANFDVFSDGVSPGRFSVNDDRRIIDGLEQIPMADDRPAFFYFHFMSAHGLGLRRPEFQQWHPSALVLDWVALITGHYESELMRNTYDNGVFQADHYLAQAFSILKAKGYLDNYIGVLTGDHGESLGERGHYGHLGYLYMEGIGIPIVFLGSQKMDLGPLPMGSQIDIAPTLFDQLGLTPPVQWKGQSLAHKPPPEVLYSESRRNGEDWCTVLKKSGPDLYQYIHINSPPTNTREMFFDLSTDPGAQTDLATDQKFAEPLGEFRRLASRQFHPDAPGSED